MPPRSPRAPWTRTPTSSAPCAACPRSSGPCSSWRRSRACRSRRSPASSPRPRRAAWLPPVLSALATAMVLGLAFVPTLPRSVPTDPTGELLRSVLAEFTRDPLWGELRAAGGGPRGADRPLEARARAGEPLLCARLEAGQPRGLPRCRPRVPSGPRAAQGLLRPRPRRDRARPNEPTAEGGRRAALPAPAPPPAWGRACSSAAPPRGREHVARLTARAGRERAVEALGPAGFRPAG